MRRLASRSLALALPLTIACGAPPAPARAPERAAWTGDVSEEAFVRMHELTGERAPAPRGTDVTIDGDRAYLALPEGEARAAVLVIHEWWGLNDHIRHWADRLAGEGYSALAIDLYGGETASTPERAMELMRAVDEERAAATIARAIAFLRSDPRVAAAPRRGVIGWCFGGGWALEAALRSPSELDAVVVYYGRPVTDVARLSGLRAPLLGIFGDRDESIPPARVDEFDRALTDAGVAHEILRFDAPHAFANPSGPRYDATAASAAWDATRAFLDRALRPRAPAAESP